MPEQFFECTPIFGLLFTRTDFSEKDSDFKNYVKIEKLKCYL